MRSKIPPQPDSPNDTLLERLERRILMSGVPSMPFCEPPAESDLVFHFDAGDVDASGSQADDPPPGTSIGNWEDQTANNLDFIASGSARPLLEAPPTGGINNRPALAFDGSNDVLTRASDAAINSGVFAEKSFAVTFQTGSDVASTQVIYEQGGTARGYNFVIDSGRLYAYVYNRIEWAGGHQHKSIDLGAIAPDTTYSVIAVHDATASSLPGRTWSAWLYDGNSYIGMATLDNADVQRPHGAQPAIGGVVGGSLHPTTFGSLGSSALEGQVGEVLSWNTALTASEVDDVRDYFHSKWYFGAGNDMYLADESTALLSVASPGVLANDVAQASAPLSVVAVNGSAANVGTQITLASGAQLTVSSDGTLEYDPTPGGVQVFDALAAGEFGSDTFTYTMSDGVTTDTAQVTLRVRGENDPIVAVDDNFSTDQDTPLSIADPGVLTNDVDPDASNTLSVTAYDDSATIGVVNMPTIDPQIGEVGEVTVDSGTMTVSLGRSYTDPVVFAFLTSRNGTDDAVARVTNVTGTSFQLHVAEPPNLDGIHVTETVHYLVVEAGTWQLDDGTLLEVGTRSMTQVAGSFASVSFSSPFATPPTVISQVQTDVNGFDFMKTRQRLTSSGAFQLSIEKHESNSATLPLAEEVGYLAIESGSGRWGNLDFVAGVTPDSVTHANYGLSFGQDLGPDVRFFGQLATFDGGDDAALRANGLSGLGATIWIEEDQTRDGETAHTTEQASFLALGGEGSLLGVAQGGGGSTGGFTYDPNGQFEWLGAGETAIDTFEYTVTDGQGSSDTATVQITVIGTNQAPTLTGLLPDLAEVNEGSVATIRGSYTDVDISDGHTVLVHWGDGVSTFADVDAATRTFTATHVYADDDPTATSRDTYTIRAEVTDEHGLSDTAATSLDVVNVEPSIGELTVTPIDFDGSVSLALQFSDPGAGDSFQAIIDWGDGSSETRTVPNGSSPWTTTHVYGDFNGESQFDIHVTLIDDDGGSIAAATTATAGLFYVEDSFHDFANGFDSYFDVWRDEQTADVAASETPTAPVLTGTAPPLAQVAIRLFDSTGTLVGERFVQADIAGNWLASVPISDATVDEPDLFVELAVPSPAPVARLLSFDLPFWQRRAYVEDGLTVDGVLAEQAHAALGAQQADNLRPLTLVRD